MRRKTRIILLLAAVLFLVFLLLWFAVSETRNLSPVVFGDAVLLFSLFIVVLLLFLITFFVLGRNIFKLLLEKKRKVVGAQFKSKLVLFFVGFSMIPAFLLFFFASGIISRNIEGWFNTPIESIMQESQGLKELLQSEYETTTLHFAKVIADEVIQKQIYRPGENNALSDFLIAKIKEYNLDLLSFYDNNTELVTILNPELPLSEYKSIPENLILKGIVNGTISRSDKLGNGEINRGGASVQLGGHSLLVITGKYLDEKKFEPLRKIGFSIRKYNQLKSLKDPIASTYILIFLFVTLFIIFAASWLGIHLAKEITVPIERLAAATKKVSQGDLNVSIHYETEGEFKLLIDSFNKMIREIAQSRKEMEEQKDGLRRGKEFQESILQNVRAGILVFSSQGLLIQKNATAMQLLRIPSDSEGKGAGEILESPELSPLKEPLKELFEQNLEGQEYQCSLSIDGEKKEIGVKVTRLREKDGKPGEVVVVFDDLTQIIRAKRLADWKMIAEKVAHELKNPLTPIQLSAQRVLKNLDQGEEKFRQVAREASLTILSEIPTLKNMLDNFLSFARLPSPRFKETDLNRLIEETTAIFREINKGMELTLALDPLLPSLLIDPEQINRVFVNLLNNAAEAMNRQGSVRISSRREEGRVVVDVEDNGPGIPEQLQETIFLPYVSTKEKGSGLGLSIISQIMQEHRGRITLDKSHLSGAKFTLEFRT